MFWLARIDHHGQPTVSYKDGAPGFVRVLDPKTLEFPSYDGNGMFYSMENIVTTSSVGMLFMDLEKPFRFRVQGDATVSADDPLLPQFPGAQLIVRVAVTAAFQNCPRYVHRYAKVQQSRYVPDLTGAAPLAGWMRIEDIQRRRAPGSISSSAAAGPCLQQHHCPRRRPAASP